MQDIFIKRLVALMGEQNMTQLELSRLVGTTNVTISRYVNGERNPRIEIVAKIAEVLGISIDYLLGFSDVKNFTNSKNIENLSRIQNKLESLDLLDSKKQLSEAQLVIIEKLLDANKDFIKQLKNNNAV